MFSLSLMGNIIYTWRFYFLVEDCMYSVCNCELSLSFPQLSEALGPSDESTKHADSSAMELLLLLQRLLLGIIYSHSPPDNEHKDSKCSLSLYPQSGIYY